MTEDLVGGQEGLLGVLGPLAAGSKAQTQSSHPERPLQTPHFVCSSTKGGSSLGHGTKYAMPPEFVSHPSAEAVLISLVLIFAYALQKRALSGVSQRGVGGLSGREFNLFSRFPVFSDIIRKPGPRVSCAGIMKALVHQPGS